MVHRRDVDGQEVVFGNQGALWGNAMTWWDHDTGSVWSQPLGEAIAGPRTGATVELVSSELTTWSAWRDEHPQTLALDAPGAATRFDLEDLAVVVDYDAASRAYPIPELWKSGVANDVVADVKLAVVADPEHPDRWQVFSRVVDDRTLDLALVDGVLVDATTRWSFNALNGTGTSGTPHDLAPLPGFTAFPRDYTTFWPDGSFWLAEPVTIG
jgi:hypothetical protein